LYSAVFGGLALAQRPSAHLGVKPINWWLRSYSSGRPGIPLRGHTCDRLVPRQRARL